MISDPHSENNKVIVVVEMHYHINENFWRVGWMFPDTRRNIPLLRFYLVNKISGEIVKWVNYVCDGKNLHSICPISLDITRLYHHRRLFQNLIFNINTVSNLMYEIAVLSIQIGC